VADQTSPFPRTGIDETACRSRSIAPQCRRAVVLRGAAGIEIGEQRVVDARAHLHRHRHRTRGAHRGGDDPGEQLEVHGQRRAAANLVDFLSGAAEIQVYVVDLRRFYGDSDRSLDDVRIDAVQLQAPDRLVGTESHHVGGARISLDHGACRHHFAHVESGAVRAAQPAKGQVRDAGHRRENHGRVNR
jgi:hypothetical protein